MVRLAIEIILAISLLQLDSGLVGKVEGIVCYRCDSLNQGETCEGNPASRHLRNYGDEEPCLTFEEVNNQYLGLQQDLDSEWYFSAVNGDHGLPVHLLRDGLIGVNGNNDSGLSHDNGPFIHSDRDVACLFVRSMFHHDLDEDDPKSKHPAFVLWFRKCVQLPAMDAYPVCGKANIYKGHIELCVCRTDRCNMDSVRREPDRTVLSHHLRIGDDRSGADAVATTATASSIKFPLLLLTSLVVTINLLRQS